MIDINYWTWPIRWFKVHGFPYKIRKNHCYWQTAIQTGELVVDENGKETTIWHNREYFNQV